jgi:acyl-homoserine lactone acylase PvdQ
MRALRRLVRCGAAVLGWQPAGAALAQPEAVQAAGQVTLYRDEWGVPHLYAAREEDGFYGLGYTQAEDQLERLLVMYLNAQGEQARVLGSSYVESDVRQRLWRHQAEARAGFARLPPQLQRNYRHYVAGFNRYMKEHPSQTPDWAFPLEPWDPLALSRAVLWLEFQAGDGLRDCARGGGLAAAPARSATLAVAGSNEWVLAPWRTADNATIVLSDPHGGLVFGSYLHEFRIDAGPLKAAGYGIGALPILMHTANVSWGMTIGAPDASDCYEVELDPANPTRYRYDGVWQTMIRHAIAIPVKGAKPARRVLEYTRHNGVLSPVVGRRNGKAYVVSTPYMDQVGIFDEEMRAINLARNVGEVKVAMRRLGMYPQNLMFGDADGGTLYVRAGRTPRRPGRFDWTRPVPGNTSATAWTGVHSFEDLVQLESPPEGYMQNNNIAPDMMLERSPLRAERYPAHLFNDTPGRTNSRGMRAVEVLSRALHFSVADAIELALDEKWMGAESWIAALRRAASQEPGLVRSRTSTFREVLERLLRFDGVARIESVAALAFYYWREAITSQRSRTELETLTRAIDESGELPPAAAAALLDGVEQAVARMRALHGSTERSYGDVFRAGRGGQSLPLGGGDLGPRDRSLCSVHRLLCVATLRAFSFGEPDSLGRRWAASGSRLLRLVVFTKPLQSFTLHIYGQSERPDSPHYADQTRLFSERRLKPTYFERAELMKHLESSRRLDVAVP